MPVHSALPSVQHLRVVVLFDLNASLVLQLSQLSRSLLIHQLLKLASHRAVPFTHLSKHVGLVHLLHHARLDHLVLVGLVLTFNLRFHILPLIRLHPLLLAFEFLLQLDLLLSVRVNILQQVDACLVLTVPLLLASLPLLCVLLSHQLVNHLLVGLLVLALLLGELLQLDGLSTVTHSLIKLQLFECLLSF